MRSVYESHTRVVNLFPFIIQPGRAISATPVSGSCAFSLSMKGRITRVYGGWSVAEYSNALRGIIRGPTEGFQGRTADEGVKARDIRADMVDRRKMMTLVRYALARKAFRSLFP